MITLYVNYYQDKSPARQKEIDETLIANSHNKYIDQIVVIGMAATKFPHLVNEEKKIILLHSETRPTFNDFLHTAIDFVELKSPNSIHIVANSDIQFDESIGKLNAIAEKNIALALSRDDIDAHAKHLDVTWSQDAWVFWGKPNIDAPFYLGLRGCDNRLAWLIKDAGYRLYDLAPSINLIHNHKTQIRNYSTKGDEDLVPKPYSSAPLTYLQELELYPSFDKKDKNSPKTVLHISLLYSDLDKALCRNIASMASDGAYYHVIDWISARKRSQHYLDSLIINAAEKLKPDFTFMQIQMPGVIKPDIAAQIPGKVVNWTGDARRPIPAWYKEVAKNITLSLFSNQTDALEMIEEGFDADFLQTGFHPEFFNSTGTRLPSAPQIVFMGNNYQDQFPLCQFRRDMVGSLRHRWKELFQVFGNSWGPGTVNLSNPLDEAQMYRSCKIAIGCSHFDLSRYSSDRLFRAMACGAFYLTKWYPEIEVDFIPGVHLETWQTLDELHSKIEFYLREDSAREKIARAGHNLLHARDTWNNRLEEMKELIEW